MNLTTKVLTSVAVIIGAVGLASATPQVGVIAPTLAAGNQPFDIHERGVAVASNGGEFRVKVQSEGPSTATITDNAFAVGGQNGWHSHPGIVVTILLSGTIEWFDENCAATVHRPGDSWVEGSQPHAFRNIGTTPVHIMAFFITAQGEALRTDQPAPACAVGLGL